MASEGQPTDRSGNRFSWKRGLAKINPFKGKGHNNMAYVQNTPLPATPVDSSTHSQEAPTADRWQSVEPLAEPSDAAKASQSLSNSTEPLPTKAIDREERKRLFERFVGGIDNTDKDRFVDSDRLFVASEQLDESWIKRQFLASGQGDALIRRQFFQRNTKELPVFTIRAEINLAVTQDDAGVTSCTIYGIDRDIDYLPESYRHDISPDTLYPSHKMGRINIMHQGRQLEMLSVAYKNGQLGYVQILLNKDERKAFSFNQGNSDDGFFLYGAGNAMGYAPERVLHPGEEDVQELGNGLKTTRRTLFTDGQPPKAEIVMTQQIPDRDEPVILASLVLPLEVDPEKPFTDMPPSEIFEDPFVPPSTPLKDHPGMKVDDVWLRKSVLDLMGIEFNLVADPFEDPNVLSKLDPSYIGKDKQQRE